LFVFVIAVKEADSFAGPFSGLHFPKRGIDAGVPEFAAERVNAPVPAAYTVEMFVGMACAYGIGNQPNL
jgi:hypothetical protein